MLDAYDARKLDEARTIAPRTRAWVHPGTGETRLYINNVAEIIRERSTSIKAYIAADDEVVVQYAQRQATADLIVASVEAHRTPAAAVPETMGGDRVGQWSRAEFTRLWEQGEL